jgi:hypothetical protein
MRRWSVVGCQPYQQRAPHCLHGAGAQGRSVLVVEVNRTSSSAFPHCRSSVKANMPGAIYVVLSFLMLDRAVSRLQM